MNQKQIRYTLEDTLQADNDLSSLIDAMLTGKSYFESNEDRVYFRDLVARAFLGAGSGKNQKPIVHVIRVKDKPFNRIVHLKLATNAHQFALHVLAELTGETKTFNSTEQGVFGVVIPSKELWQKFKDSCTEIFPVAQTEALHISKEARPGSGSGAGYIVDNDEESDL
ncbi:MAG: hypothetical protein IMZ43_06475 [Thermoplasmata archaeon]|nr:hypothetical protein [Thermoplasmata archaeon]